jgi:uroporphyrinogen decarboxylase
MKMTSRERVLTALHLGQPDRVPWVESYIHDELASALLGRVVKAPASARIPPEILEVLPLDNISYNLKPPDLASKTFSAKQDFIGDGLIKTWDDFEKIKLPDPDDDRLYEPARDYIAKNRKDRAAVASLRCGVANAYLSAGIETFSYLLYDDPKLVEALLDLFTSWSARMMAHINELGFDMAIIAEDLGSKTGPLFSPKIVRELFLPRMRKVVNVLKIPWIYHSDGNIMSILDDLLTLGMKGIANIEPGAMDIEQLKRDYGGKICLMGNIDLHYTLTMGTPEETENEVRKRIETIGRGGGYILATSNGLANYCKPENVLAMKRTLEKYGTY